MKNLRKLAILLLDDESGINEAAYNELAAELTAVGHTDILNAVTAQDGRFYLGEDDAHLLAVGVIPDGEYSLVVVDGKTPEDVARHFENPETPLGEQIEGD